MTEVRKGSEQGGFLASPGDKFSPDRVQTAILVKAILDDDRDGPGGPFDELERLAETAGLTALDRVAQRRARPSPATYIGRGKAMEVQALARSLDADLILFDNDLTPAQERNLERITGRTIIDRTELIMDIFARHARSRQAKAQVELAQLEYTLPRLKRLWTHLSRYEGGIGMRGPGEKQIETDRRLVKRRIVQLRRELREIARDRETSRQGRKESFFVALVGYTNVGKSTLLNRLTSSNEYVADKLFATLDTRTRRWELGGNRYVLLNDTVGFIRGLPAHLVASFEATLAETRDADLLLHVVDASAPNAEEQIAAVEEVLARIGCTGKRRITVFNKWDRVEQRLRIDAQVLRGQFDGIALSAVTGEGLETLRDRMIQILDEDRVEIEVSIPTERGDLIAFLSSRGTVFERRCQGSKMVMRVRLGRADAQRYQAMAPGRRRRGREDGAPRRRRSLPGGDGRSRGT